MIVFATLFAAAAGTDEPSGLDLLLPRDRNEIIAGLIAFLIVFFFIWRYAVPGLNEMLANRQKAVKDRLEAAEREKEEAAALKGDYDKQLADARAEAAQIIEEARQAGESVRAGILAKAETEADATRTRAQAELLAERERAFTAMRREVAGLSLDVAEKLVGASLDRTGQQELVDRFIDELGGAES